MRKLINSGLMSGGIYRALNIKQDDNRIYIPGLMNNNVNIINNDNSLNIEKYEKMKDSLPKPLFNSIALKEMLEDDVTPCWIVFENGDSSRPIVMGYLGRGVKSGGSGLILDSGNFIFTGHGTINPKYLVLHTIAGPSESVDAVVKVLKENDLGVHGIISNTGVTQLAEWNSLQYHVGNANSVSIGLEMLECENIVWNTTTWVPSWTDDERVKSYHEDVYKNAVEIYAKLANTFNISKENILSHKEINVIFGGDHTDPEALWNEFKSKWNDDKWDMDEFRKAVEEKRKTIGTVGNYSKYIFVGDSRTNGMKSAVENKSNETWICKDGAFFEYAVDNKTNIINAITQNTIVYILLGVNGLSKGTGTSKATNDAATLNNLYAEIKSSKSNINFTFCFVSVNPVGPRFPTFSNTDIVDYNNEMKNKINSEISYLDIYNKLSINNENCNDGLHYNADVYKEIYGYLTM